MDQRSKPGRRQVSSASAAQGYLGFATRAATYPIAGMPAIVSGRDALAELFAGFSALAAWIRVEDVRFHATADPDLAFVEERMLAALHDGSAYENDLCLRVGFRDGRIASIYEYYGERAHEGLLERLAAATAGTAGTERSS
jgi:ketosteroid isomerase-like protein